MTDLEAQVAAASGYEDFLVPALLAEWAPRMVEAARLREGQRVLDVACGTGILARAAAAAVGSGGRVAGVDLNQGMLAVAARLAPDIEWSHGPAESLMFPDASFDAVVSQFGLMFFTDRQRAVHEMLRVVVPGGRLAVAVWDALERIPVYRAEVDLLQRIAGDRAADALRAPFVLGDTEKLRELFVAAGAKAVAVETHAGTARFPSVRSLMESDLTGWLPIMGVVLPPDQVHRILQEAEDALAPFVSPDGRLEFESPAHIVTASRAHSTEAVERAVEPPDH